VPHEPKDDLASDWRSSVSDRPYETPDPSLIASIQHEAEKLGYLVAQVEEMFKNRVRHERKQILIQHGLESIRIERRWIDGELNDEQASELQAVLAEETSDANDQLKISFDVNINRLNQIVTDGITTGKNQQDELNYALDQILKED